MESISPEIFKSITKPLIGMEVSHVWQGHGSAIFLELGKLSTPREQRNTKGEYTIMIEDSWRVENNENIIFGSWSEPEDIPNLLASLKKHTIKNIIVVGHLPELRVQLSSLEEIQSFATTAGDPQWAILLPGRSIYSKSGKVVQEDKRE